MIRRLAAAALTIAAVALTGCGEEHEVTRGETEGVYVWAGGVKYQVQISRVLNPSDAEDREYLLGLPAAERRLQPDQNWFAVFVRAENESKEQSRVTASRFHIDDTTGAEFEPLELSANVNPHFYAPTRLAPETVYPAPNTTAGGSTIGGSLVLFKLPEAALGNRPLEFRIASPTGAGEATVDLDV